MDDVATKDDVATAAAAARRSSTNQQSAAKEMTPRAVTTIIQEILDEMQLFF